MQIHERRTSAWRTGLGRGGILRGGRKKKTTESKHLWASVLCRRRRHHSRGRFSLCFFVNSSAFFMNLARSLQYSSARSALRGCSGSGQVTRVISAFRTLTTESKPDSKKFVNLLGKFNGFPTMIRLYRVAVNPRYSQSASFNSHAC